jgi:hypothetical protein
LYLEGHINKSNGFLLYLKNTNDLEALKYLDFLQKCEGLNSVYADPWERKTIAELPIRNQLITKALIEFSLSQDQEIKQRYAFMAIRLAYYNLDYPLLKKSTKPILLVNQKRQFCITGLCISEQFLSRMMCCAIIFLPLSL